MQEQHLPSAADIERAVVGAMFIDPGRTIGKVGNAGGKELFLNTANALIYEALDYMHEEGQVIDQLTVEERLKCTGMLKQAGGCATITAIINECASAANIDSHLAILRDKLFRRKLIRISDRMEALCQTPGMSTAEISEDIQDRLAECRALSEGRERTLTEQVREWASVTKGNFLVTDCYRDLHIVTKSNKAAVRVTLGRLVEEGIIERIIGKHGQYRRIEGDCEKMDWKNASMDTVNFSWPGGIERFVSLMPGNVVLIAGEPNAGKTAFLLNTVLMNMARHEIHYFSSEMGASEMKKRLSAFSLSPDDWRFTPWERSGDFHDVIRPDAVNIIDYLEIHEDFYRIGGQIKRIFDRLGNGLAIIAIQKNRKTDMGRGGITTLEKPRLCLSMKPGELRIVKGKSWVGTTNPNGLSSRFTLSGGARFNFDSWGGRATL